MALPIAILSVPLENSSRKGSRSAGPHPRDGAVSPPSERCASWSPPIAQRCLPLPPRAARAPGWMRSFRLALVVRWAPFPSIRCMAFVGSVTAAEDGTPAPDPEGPGAGRMGRNMAFSSRSSNLRSGTEVPVAPRMTSWIRSDDVRRLGYPHGVRGFASQPRSWFAFVASPLGARNNTWDIAKGKSAPSIAVAALLSCFLRGAYALRKCTPREAP